jgi:hypothetical protein
MSFSLKMGLKPLGHICFTTHPFTKVKGNICFNSEALAYLLPSALADGFRTPDKKGFSHIYDFINQ